MVWCSSCSENIGQPDYVEGMRCCTLCGRVFDDCFSHKLPCVKCASGQSDERSRINKMSKNEVVESAESDSDSDSDSTGATTSDSSTESESLSNIDDIEEGQQQDMKNYGLAQTDVQAREQFLPRKRLVPKVNYDFLKSIFDEPESPVNAKKSRTEPELDCDDNDPKNSKDDPEID